MLENPFMQLHLKAGKLQIVMLRKRTRKTLILNTHYMSRQWKDSTLTLER